VWSANSLNGIDIAVSIWLSLKACSSRTSTNEKSWPPSSLSLTSSTLIVGTGTGVGVAVGEMVGVDVSSGVGTEVGSSVVIGVCVLIMVGTGVSTSVDDGVIDTSFSFPPHAWAASASTTTTRASEISL